MIDVVKAESYKFICSKAWKMSLLIGIVFSFFMILSAHTDVWQEDLLHFNERIEQNLSMSAEEIQHSTNEDSQINQWKINNAYLETNTQIAATNTFQGYMSGLLSLRMLGLVLILFPILFAVQIANDYEKGTIKYLMISPHSRIQLALGKYTAVLIASFLFLAFVFAINFVLSYLIMDKSSSTFFYMSHNQVISTNIFLFMLKNNLLSLVYYLSYLTFAFMLAIISRSTTVSLSVSLFFALLGTQLIGLVSLPRRFMQFVLMEIVDLSHSENSLTLVEQNNYSLLSCLGIILLYLIIFLVVALEVFKRQDI